MRGQKGGEVREERGEMEEGREREGREWTEDGGRGMAGGQPSMGCL